MQVIIRDNVLEGVKDPVGYKARLDAELIAKPTKEWERAMSETDAKLPRYAEDIIDAMPKAQQDKLSAKTLEAYNEKKQRRAEKP